MKYIYCIQTKKIVPYSENCIELEMMGKTAYYATLQDAKEYMSTHFPVEAIPDGLKK